MQLLRNELREVEALMRGVSGPSEDTRKVFALLCFALLCSDRSELSESMLVCRPC